MALEDMEVYATSFKDFLVDHYDGACTLTSRPVMAAFLDGMDEIGFFADRIVMATSAVLDCVWMGVRVALLVDRLRNVLEVETDVVGHVVLGVTDMCELIIELKEFLA